MEDKYFDKKLKKLFESPPEFEPSEAAISDMKTRLQQLPKTKGFPWIPLLLSLLFLLFSFGSLFIYQKYQNLQNQFTKLIQSINTTQIQIDTVFEKQVIYQIDTIYKTIYQTEYKYINTNTNSIEYKPTLSLFTRPTLFSNLSTTSSPSNDFRWGLGTYDLPLFATRSDSSLFSNDINNSNPDNYETQKSNSLQKQLKQSFAPMDRAEWLMLDLPTPSFPDFPTFPNTYKASKISLLYYFQPQSMSVQGSASPLILPIHDFGGDAFSLGATATLHFPQGRSMNIGLEYLQDKFELKEPVSFDPFPIVDPENPSDNLHELKANLSYLQIPITFQQTFLQKSKLEAAFQLGLVAYRPFRQNFIYEYLNTTGEYKLPLNLKNGSLSVDNLRVGINTSYALSSKFYLNTNLLYQHGFSMNIDEYFLLRYWALNLGIQYQLKN